MWPPRLAARRSPSSGLPIPCGPGRTTIARMSSAWASTAARATSASVRWVITAASRILRPSRCFPCCRLPEAGAMRLLVVKTSSLGDILNTLPALSDAGRERPDLEIHWAVEEALAAVPAWHPAVARVIPVGLGRWRRKPRAREILASIRRVREQRYDLIIDAQGLAKSALLTLAARGPVCGFDFTSAREGIVSLLYGRRATASWELHAIDRQRRLFAQALGYPLPET